MAEGKERASCRQPTPRPCLFVYYLSSCQQLYFFSTHWKNTPKLRSNFSKKLEASDEDLMTGVLRRRKLP